MTDEAVKSSRLAALVQRLFGGQTAERGSYRAAMESPQWAVPFRAMTYTALDCEMTGLDPKKDEILSIGAVRIRESRVVLRERVYQVFKPIEAVSPKEIILIHGLDNDEVSLGKPLTAALDDLLAFLGDSVLVGHYTEIDLSFLNAALTARGRPPLHNATLDTRLLYHWHMRRDCPPMVNPSFDDRLEAIVGNLGLPRYPAHHAFYDALTTSLLFLKLIDELESTGTVQFRALFREAGIYPRR